MNSKCKLAVLVVLAVVTLGLCGYLLLVHRLSINPVEGAAKMLPPPPARDNPKNKTAINPDEFPDILETVPANELDRLIEQYNLLQLKTCGSDIINKCEGASSLKLQESVVNPNYLILTKTIYKKAHTEGVDGGEDIFENFVFKKGEMLQKVVTVEGDLHLLSGSHLALSVGSMDSCAGHSIDGKLSLFNLEKDGSVYEYDLNDDGHNLVDAEFDDKSDGTGALVFIKTLSQAELPGTEDKDYSIGERPMLDIHRLFELRCQSDGSNCKMTKTSTEQTQGHEIVGMCD